MPRTTDYCDTMPGEILAEAERRSADGEDYVIMDIAKQYGTSPFRLTKWCAAHPLLRDAITTIRSWQDERVQMSLYRSAMSGNVTAQVFWLKNRRPDEWRDRVEGQLDVTIKPVVLSEADKLQIREAGAVRRELDTDATPSLSRVSEATKVIDVTPTD